MTAGNAKRKGIELVEKWKGSFCGHCNSASKFTASVYKWSEYEEGAAHYILVTKACPLFFSFKSPDMLIVDVVNESLVGVLA